MTSHKSGSRRHVAIAAVLVIAVMFLTPAMGYSETLDEQVAAAVAGGQAFLFNNFHDNGDGTGYYWDESDNGDDDYYELAATAAAVAALIETGKYGDPAYALQIDKAVAYIKAQKQADGGIWQNSSKTYQNGMSLVALSLYHTVNPQDAAFITGYIQPAVDYFLNGQYTGEEGVNNGGGWGYSPCEDYCAYDGGDLSNTQFAIMGLWYAYHYVLNLSIPTDVDGSWAARLEEFVWRTQRPSGVFSYTPWGDFEAAPMNGAGLWTLAMLGIDKSDPGVEESLDWFDANYAWTNNGLYGSAYYYGIYAMSKGLAGMIPSDYQFPVADTGNPWVTDLKQAMVDTQTADGEGVNYWYSGGGLDPGSIISTAFTIMSLSFADPSTESTKKVLPDTEEPDYPIKQQGFVTLESSGGVTISNAVRGNANLPEQSKIKLPIGSFDFTLNNVPVGGTAVLKIIPPRAALDPENPDSFVNADGTFKTDINWFKLESGAWKGQGGVLIELMPAGGPYTHIEVTLKDGGPEDTDGVADGKIVDPAAPGLGEDEQDLSSHRNFCFINAMAF